MRKRPSRPQRFAAVDNNAIDTLSSILAVGLLTTLIRAKDGDDVTVETLSKTHDEGEKSLTKAMRLLVEGAYVVKFKIQRKASEAITLDDGTTETKRGGSWYTTFTVDSIPFSREDVAAMLADIVDDGNAKAIRVEPVHLDPRKDPTSMPTRPTPLKGGVGATCGNVESGTGEIAKPQVGPTRPSATPGRPTPGGRGAHIRKKTVVKDSLPAGHDRPDQQEREKEQQEDNTPAMQVLAAYQKALGGNALNGTRAQLLKDAEELLAARPLWWVIDRAAELPRYGKSLARHAEMSRVPFTRPARKPEAGKCLRHPGFPEDDCSRCIIEERERTARPRTDGPAVINGASLLASLLASSES